MNRTIFVFLFTMISTVMLAQSDTDSITGKTLDEVIITATGANRNLKAAEMGRHIISREEIIKMPVIFGEPDVVKTLHSLPGVSSGTEGFTGLYVHGGDNDQNLFMYNGLPLYHVSHLGGFFSSFNVSTIGHVDFFKSSFPARFGGRISSITDISMLTPDFKKYAGKFTIGLLAANGYISGPIIRDKLAFSAAVRRSWIDVVGLPAIAIVNAAQKKRGKKSIAGYNFMDFNARVDWKLGAGKIYAIGYYGHDYFKLGERKFDNPEYDSSYLPGGDSEITHYYDENTNKMTWGNLGVSLNADYRIGAGYINAIAYYSQYSSYYDQMNKHQSDMSDPSTYGYSLNATENSIHDFGVNAQYSLQFARLYLVRAGIGYVHHRYHPEGLINEYQNVSEFWKDNNGNPAVSANEIFAYLDNLFNFGERASLDVGVRFVNHHIHGVSFPRVEPRASVRINITGNVSVKAAYARINQFVQQVSNNYISLPTDLWQPVGLDDAPLGSDQYSLGVYGNLPNDMYFSVEGWYKGMRNLVEYRDGVSLFDPDLKWDDKTTTGKGWAYGVDLSVTKEMGKVTGSISYGLMWNWRKFSALNGGEKFPAKFDNRNKINVSATYRLNEHIEFNAGWTYMTGNRLTLSLYNYDGVGNLFPDAPNPVFPSDEGLDYYDERNNVRLPAYHRLDIGMSLYRNLKNGRRTIWNFGLYNAYCRMNAITIKKTHGLGSNYFQKLGLIPVIPSASFTYEF